MIKRINRRGFLKLSSVSGGALAMGLPLGLPIFQKNVIEHFQPNKFLLFQKDGTVKLFSGRSELGQGTNTNIIMMVAEELCIEPSKIKLEIQLPKEGFYVGTGGSWGTAAYYRMARPIFATARQAFINAAAKKWEVFANECSVENGAVLHHKTGRKYQYPELFETVLESPIPTEAPTIPTSEFKYLKKSHPNQHLAEQVSGQAIYGIDFRVPNMLYASIERCLVSGGTLKSVDSSEALKMEGVLKVVPMEGTSWDAYDYRLAGVAVLATDSWTAQEARKKLKIDWETGENDQLDSVKIDSIFNEKLKSEGKVAFEVGDFENAKKNADEVLEAKYSTPFWSHSPMEPMNTVAHYQNDSCELWTACHVQTRLLKAVKELTGFADEKIKIHTTLMGGSFGRRLLIDYALEALILSKVVGQPVQMLNTRIDETKTGHFMSGSKFLVRASLKENKLDAIGVRSAGLSIYQQREPELLKEGIDNAWLHDLLRYPYTFPNVKYDQHFAPEIQIPVLWWRGTFANINSFVMESWMDEIAHHLKKDAIDFRLSFLENDSAVQPIEGEAPVDINLMKRVLTTARDKSNWSQKSKKRSGKGIATCYSFFESYAALVADVYVSKKKKLCIKKMTCVVDCGLVLNPDMVKAQIEGGIHFALSAMKSSIEFENGKVVENSFKDYPILTYEESPKIEIHLIDSERPVSGVGELSNVVTFAAIGNAIFNACGVRVRELPLRGFRLV